jgi:predicted DNA-binding transcriptional regulator AlpA
MKRFLTVAEVLDLLQISRPTLGRYVKLARQGASDFPLPVQTGAKTKRLWNPAAIEQWSEYRQSTLATTATIIPSPLKETKLMRERRAHTEAILSRHGIALKPIKNSDGVP